MPHSRKPIAIDIFCGAGGFSLGFHRSGFEVVAGFDIDPINVRTYSHNFPHTLAVQADVSNLSGSDVRRLAGLKAGDEIDVVCGGPPCQGFSLIGKRNASDPRNQLLVEYARLIAELSPRYFVIENVAGLMLGQARAVFARALRSLRAAGYRWATPIRTLDAQDHGVPQVRKRVIVLGYRADQNRPKYPKKLRRKVTVRQAIRDLYCLGHRKSRLRTENFVGKLGAPTAYAKKLRTSSSARFLLTGCQLCDHDPDIVHRFKATRRGSSEPISRFHRLHPDRLARTLRAGTGKDKGSFTAARPIHPTQARCITVREAARLHSFPDSFDFHGTQWHGFRQVGNSVPPLMAAAVAGEIVRAIQNAKKKSPGHPNTNQR